MKDKEESCTVGELMDFILSHNFKREDKLIIEINTGKEKEVWDIGISICNNKVTKLLFCARKMIKGDEE